MNLQQSWMICLARVWTLMALASLAGCGLGTEIGNGFKPDREDDGSDKSQKVAKADADSNDEAPVSGSAPENGDGDDEADESGSGDGSSDNNTSDPTGGTNGQAGIVVDGLDFDLSLLGAGCASPFLNMTHGALALATADSTDVRNTLKITWDESGQKWEIADGDDNLLMSVTARNNKVASVNASGGSVSDGFTCTPVQKSAGVSIANTAITADRYTTMLERGALKAKVTWFIVPEADGAATGDLVRVEIDDIDGEHDPITLSAE